MVTHTRRLRESHGNPKHPARLIATVARPIPRITTIAIPRIQRSASVDREAIKNAGMLPKLTGAITNATSATAFSLIGDRLAKL
jgi:hypothetical protein